MALEQDVMTKIKEAMKAKDKEKLASLRSIKNELLKAKTAKTSAELSQEDEQKLLQKLIKQREDSAEIYKEQGRNDLAKPEQDEADLIKEFLPEQLSEAEIEAHIDAIIKETGANSMKDMGQVMGLAAKKMAGKADGKTISAIVKKHLN
ncbi:MAG: GatB/YqeY domain-containing protein [Psychroflexus sp.]|jgi:uncharacterized protein YqeY|nr:GatB/YqeY domain-containing protein [Psychroflexus sp.]MDR9447732.1 GatB/YqeY domain-containing protein [Psychroflexus sp.]